MIDEKKNHKRFYFIYFPQNPFFFSEISLKILIDISYQREYLFWWCIIVQITHIANSNTESLFPTAKKIITNILEKFIL